MCVLGVGEQRLPLLPDKRVSVAHERQSPWAAPMRIPPGPRWPACHPPASAQPLTWGLSMYQRRQLARVSRIKYLRRNLPLFSFSSISRNPQIRFCRSTYGIPGLCSHHPETSARLPSPQPGQSLRGRCPSARTRREVSPPAAQGPGRAGGHIGVGRASPRPGRRSRGSPAANLAAARSSLPTDPPFSLVSRFFFPG